MEIQKYIETSEDLVQINWVFGETRIILCHGCPDEELGFFKITHRGETTGKSSNPLTIVEWRKLFIDVKKEAERISITQFSGFIELEEDSRWMKRLMFYRKFGAKIHWWKGPVLVEVIWYV